LLDFLESISTGSEFSKIISTGKRFAVLLTMLEINIVNISNGNIKIATGI